MNSTRAQDVVLRAWLDKIMEDDFAHVSLHFDGVRVAGKDCMSHPCYVHDSIGVSSKS